MYSSPLNAARDLKKFCSKAKTCVQGFDKLEANWNHNCGELSRLLDALKSSSEALDSIQNSEYAESMAPVRAVFPDLFDKLMGNIIVEIEDICIQIKTFLKMLGDVSFAMQFQVQEASKLTVAANEQVEGAVDSAIEDLLDVQRRFFMFKRDLLVKEQSIKKILSRNKKLNGVVNGFWLKQSLVLEAIDMF